MRKLQDEDYTDRVWFCQSSIFAKNTDTYRQSAHLFMTLVTFVWSSLFLSRFAKQSISQYFLDQCSCSVILFCRFLKKEIFSDFLLVAPEISSAELDSPCLANLDKKREIQTKVTRVINKWAIIYTQNGRRNKFYGCNFRHGVIWSH